MHAHATIEEILQLASRLSPLDRQRLIERLQPASAPAGTAPGEPRRGLRGLFKGHSIGSQEIEQARGEMWGNFPREDL